MNDSRSNAAITRCDYTEDMEYVSGRFNIQPSARIDNSAFCEGCGFWKHDIIITNGRKFCGPCFQQQ